jgi:hypothetical protein
MPLQYRVMRANDVHALVKIVASDPVLESRYRGALVELEMGLMRILDQDSAMAPVFEWTEANQRHIVGFGIRSFVSDAFARLLTTPPFPWAGRELMIRASRRESPLLSDAELRSRNAADGLNLLLWFAWMRPEFRRPDVMNFYMQIFVEVHRGFRLKQIISQCDMMETVEARLNAGLPLLLEDGTYTSVAPMEPEKLVMTPHCFRLTREHVLAHPASWFSYLFEYAPPQIFFSPSQQRLLQAAMRGGTDEELAGELHISVSAVKKAWRAIYDRVKARAPEWLPDDARPEDSLGERGPSRKHRLLSRLRQHPEELRPLPRKKEHPLATAAHL